MKELLFNLFYDGSTGISPVFAIVSMSVALVLSAFVALTYKLTYSGVSYSKKFNSSLIMMSLITTKTVLWQVLLNMLNLAKLTML